MEPVYSGHPNQLAAIQRWPDYTVIETCVYRGHPSRPNQLAAIQRWPDYTVKPVYRGHPSGSNQLAAIQRWPDYTVKPVYSGHPSRPNQLYRGGLIVQWNLCIVATPQDPTSSCYTEA